MYIYICIYIWKWWGPMTLLYGRPWLSMPSPHPRKIFLLESSNFLALLSHVSCEEKPISVHSNGSILTLVNSQLFFAPHKSIQKSSGFLKGWKATTSESLQSLQPAHHVAARLGLGFRDGLHTLTSRVRLHPTPKNADPHNFLLTNWTPKPIMSNGITWRDFRVLYSISPGWVLILKSSKSILILSHCHVCICPADCLTPLEDHHSQVTVIISPIIHMGPVDWTRVLNQWRPTQAQEPPLAPGLGSQWSSKRSRGSKTRLASGNESGAWW